MGMPAEAPRRWTAREVAEMQQEDRPFPRFELIDGDLLVTPSPGSPHQFVVAELFFRLYGHLRGHPEVRALMSPADIRLDPTTVVQPDIFVFPRGTEPLTVWSAIRSLLLAVEVVSPGSKRRDRTIKRDFYMSRGVAEYWIVDVDAQTIECWLAADHAASYHTTTIEWRVPGIPEPLVIDIPELFHAAIG